MSIVLYFKDMEGDVFPFEAASIQELLWALKRAQEENLEVVGWSAPPLQKEQCDF